MNNRKRLLWITQTAVFLALIIVSQLLTQSASQFVTGSLVNLLLILCGACTGLASALSIAILSPILAFLFGIGPAFIQLIPFVMLGNIVIVAITAPLFRKSTTSTYWLYSALGVLIGMFAKFGTLWLGVVQIGLKIIPEIKPPQVERMSMMFSWPQLITACIGGVLAIIIYPYLRRILHSKT